MLILPSVQPERHHLNHHHDYPDASDEDVKPVQRHQREEGRKISAAGRIGATTEHRREAVRLSSLGAVNPTLTVIAHAHRVADIIKDRL